MPNSPLLTRLSLTSLSVQLIAALVAGCGGSGDGGGGPGNTTRTMSIASGDAQTARINSNVAVAPAVIVRDANNQPVPGVSVTFAIQAGGGSVTGATAVTNASGVATVGSWKLGSTVVPNTLAATASGITGSVLFNATPRLPYWTVLVYMAADNNLAISGILDIDEMEAAGYDPEVQVAVQAEFSPTYLNLEGCNASCFNRPNFNTFRYFLSGQGTTVHGPNGPTTDLGNRNMIDPAQLREFVQWGKSNYPAQHYAVVLWNHGAGYTGLLQDLTTAGEALMALSDLPVALNGLGPIDVLDFDMCLMGAYETTALLNGLVSYAVFSQEVEPGAGNPYLEILNALQANPTADGKGLAGIIVDEYDASYQGGRSSTTKSAYDLSGYAAFETALNTLAGTLRTNLPALGTAIGEAASVSQSYEYPFLKDLVNFLDSLRARTADATLRGQIDAVKAQATGAFRVRSRFHNVVGGANDVSRSNGLNVLMPSGGAGDQLPNSGPASFTAYSALYAGKAWTSFLNDWLATSGTATFKDQGSSRFEAYLVWDSVLVSRNGDVDLWILEPNGDVFIPYLGSVTPNGTLTNDSYNTGSFYEGYLTNRYIQVGTYKLYASLYSDPMDYRPVFDLLYRFDQVSGLTSLYSPTYPRLSKQVPWSNDPTPTLAEAEAGAYSDMQYAAFVTINPTTMPELQSRRSAVPPNTHEITPAQFAKIRELLAKPRTRVPGSRTRAPTFAVPGAPRP
ncbi:MAG TPA: clostripain-related cysteine peptidase [Gemmatimonadales bacterium]|nr:clostripain-related cysteine peptidase [Gemmatimonadales bacterium]